MEYYYLIFPFIYLFIIMVSMCTDYFYVALKDNNYDYENINDLSDLNGKKVD